MPIMYKVKTTLLSLEPVSAAVTQAELVTPCKTPHLLKAVSALTHNHINLMEEI